MEQVEGAGMNQNEDEDEDSRLLRSYSSFIF